MRGKAIRMAWHVSPGDLVMKNFEEPWALHEPVGSILTSRIEAEKASLKSRLDELDRRFAPLAGEVPERRPYPKVLPWYQNPSDPRRRERAAATVANGSCPPLQIGSLI